MTTTPELIDNIANDKLNDANKIFGDLIKTRLATSIEQEKAKVANAVFNQAKAEPAETEAEPVVDEV